MEIGDYTNGRVVSIKSYGAFVELENKKIGLLHISEISDDFIKSVSNHIKLKQDLELRILDIDKEGKIKLSLKDKPRRKRNNFKGNLADEKIDVDKEFRPMKIALEKLLEENKK